MSIWPGRTWALMILPTLLVLAWVAVPVPSFDPSKEEPPPDQRGVMPDVRFSFFLIWCFHSLEGEHVLIIETGFSAHMWL